MKARSQKIVLMLLVVSLSLCGVLTFGTEDAYAASGKPAKVKGVKVYPLSERSIKVSWKKVSGARGYAIYRNGKLLARTRYTSYTDKGLTAGTYAYKVRAYRTRTIKKTQYWNSQKKKWQSKKPEKSQWKGKKKKRIKTVKYIYGKYSVRKKGTVHAAGTEEVNTEEVDYGVWDDRIAAPSKAEISSHNAASTARSPYISGWLKTGSLGRFTEYAIDFKADYAPPYTYCCLGSFYLDYSALETQYSKVYTDGINGYAGLQKKSNSETPNSILSFWDVYCENADGQVVRTIRAELVYPEPNGNDGFDNEGSGVHHLGDYDWHPGMWYRMVLQCGRSETTGNTTIEQWVCDLSAGEWTKLCEYDLGTPDVAFRNDVCVFLENFNPSTSGDIRTMEVKNIRVKKEGTDEWVSVRNGSFNNDYSVLGDISFNGSYNFGADADKFWIVTTGLPGKSDNKPATAMSVTGGESSSPY